MKTMLLIFLILTGAFPVCSQNYASDYRDERSYIGIVEKGDELLRKRNFKKARELFKRATLIKPSDSYPKAQLFLIDRLLSGE